jgi:aminoglycoside 2'-N-acetyltransferase I
MELPAMTCVRTDELSPDSLSTLRTFLDGVFPDFSDDNWNHALGGVHFLIAGGKEPVAHASVVPRPVSIGGRAVRTGYVEAVSVTRARQRCGLGTALMREANDFIRDQYEIGVLETIQNGFYERLGWRTWTGPTGVASDGGWTPTPHQDGNVMILPTQTTPVLDESQPIVTDWRTRVTP